MSSRDRDERGASLLITGVLMVVLVVMTAFAVDLGMQRVVRRDMQAVADVAALDLSRLLTGDVVSQYVTTEFDTALSRSVDRNDSYLGDDLAVVACSALTSRRAGICWEFVEKSGTDWVVAASTDVPDAVRVRAKSTIGFAFGGVTGVGEGSATRTAVAAGPTNGTPTTPTTPSPLDAEACFSLGSYAARLDSGSSPLLKALVEGALGGSIGLDAVSYQGLVDADVKLLAVATELGLGSVDELLDANVTAAAFAVAAAKALQNGGGDTADVTALQTIAARVGSHMIKVGDLVSAQSGGHAAETLNVNALDLVAGAAFLANGTNLLYVPALHASLPLVGTSVTTTVRLIEKASRACGKKDVTFAETSQLALTVNGTVATPPKVLGLNVTGGATTIALNVAPARGTMTDVVCGGATASSPSGEDIRVASGLISTSLSTRVDVDGTVGDSLLGGLLSGLTGLLSSVVSLEVQGSVTLTAGMTEPSTQKTAAYRVPPRAWGDRYPLGTGDLGLNQASVTPTSTLTIKAKGLLGLNVALTADQILKITDNLVAGLVSQVTNPLITAINSSLLAPVSDVLGLSIGGADVYAEKPTCPGARLVG